MRAAAKSINRPGRPREFEAENVIRDAMEVFQTHGYAGTSIVELMQGTRLTRGSLYKAFSDKRTLFLAALNRYMSMGTEALRANLEKGSSTKAIRSALLSVAETSSTAAGRRGCLLVASTNELASKDSEVRKRARQTFNHIQALLEQAIRKGQASAEISSRRNPKDLARLLLCTIEGMGVLGKTGRTQREMELIVDVAMDVLK